MTGKAIYKNVLGKTQAEVKEKLKSAIEKNGSLVTIAKRYTVGQWLDAWMENYARLQVRASSYKTYQGFIENHIKVGFQIQSHFSSRSIAFFATRIHFSLFMAFDTSNQWS